MVVLCVLKGMGAVMASVAEENRVPLELVRVVESLLLGMA